MAYNGIEAVTAALDTGAQGYPDCTVLREEVIAGARMFLVQGGTLAPGRLKWVGMTTITDTDDGAACAAAIRENLLVDNKPFG